MEYLFTLVLGALAGFLARWYMLRRDYRQYPSYPQGWAIHLFLGFIGGLIGAVIVPALMERDFSAVSFLLLAATQFREVRNMERNTLTAMEATEMVGRGSGYIEGIARVFEARNYLAIWVALAAAVVSQLFDPNRPLQIVGGFIVALCLAWVLNRLMQGSVIGEIADVELAELGFDGPVLQVNGVHVMNVGLSDARRTWIEKGLGAVVRPKGPDAKATLGNIGQMQAIAHDVISMIGLYMDVGEQEFVPVVRRERESGSLVMAIVPSEPDADAFLEAIRRVPVLEGAIRKPLSSRAGRMLD
ncbi:MAG: hypothetical protein GX195_04190 [Firmicutes bacterium]|jgi:uncharacterized membrane protein YeaQ/YmgE (transglycosylase-associated protein family)|nr:hypothetical protein [Bacillota bacterium]